MRSALVGSTGFVGSNLQRQTHFDDLFHSTDIAEIHGRSYDLLVLSAAPAEKWRANKEPEKDLANISSLMAHIAQVSADHVVLISTVDVFGAPDRVTEDSRVDPAAATAYGRHRYQLEEFVRAKFDTTCVRLPGLFGEGLKKNIIYDFIHGNALGAINPQSEFQFYGLGRLWRDIEIARRHELELAHLATEPVSVSAIAREAFGMKFENPGAPAPVRYDMHTKHAALFGGAGPYVMSRSEVLAEIAAFVGTARRREA